MVVTLVSSEHLDHDDLRNSRAGDASLRHRGFYGDAAQFMSGSGSESAEEAADRCALGSGDDDVGHETGLQNIHLSDRSRLSLAGCFQKPFRQGIPKLCPRPPADDHANMATIEPQSLSSLAGGDRRNYSIRFLQTVENGTIQQRRMNNEHTDA